MENKYKKHLQNVMDAVTVAEAGVLLVSGLAACGNWIYLIPFVAAVAAILYTRLWMRRWKLEAD